MKQHPPKIRQDGLQKRYPTGLFQRVFFNDGNHGYPQEYFECVEQTRINRKVAACPKRHQINQVWANVHICGFDDKLEIAEYDLVLVTNFGTIIPMDAKSYDFAKKDEDARLYKKMPGCII